jgi:hypothetical protein
MCDFLSEKYTELGIGEVELVLELEEYHMRSSRHHVKRVREILASPPAASILNNDNHEDKQQQQLPNVTGDVSSERPDMDCYSAHRQVIIN